MKWFRNLTIGSKLVLGFSLTIALFALNVFEAFRGMQQISGKASIASAAQTISENVERQRALMLTLLVEGGAEAVERTRPEIEAIAEENASLQRQLDELTSDSPQLGALTRRFADLRADYARIRHERSYPALVAGDPVAARRVIMDDQRGTYAELREAAQALVAETAREAQRAIKRSRQILLGESVAVLVASAALVLLLTRLISEPLQGLARAAERIGAGDLEENLADLDRKDEVGALSATFRKMHATLSEMAGVARRIADRDLTVIAKAQSEKDQLGNAFTRMVANLRESATELNESVNALASTASEILAGTSQINASAAETDTAISETSTTIEEVRQTAKISSQKAKTVADRAQDAARTGETGRDAVDAAVSAMRNIQSQMETMAQSIVRLSEQSQSIGEIIAAVNDLAEQSNLLAVNAAIEAAKAGEHGRGFSVVAQEVRSLAEQSKQATSEIRSILHDIQKATTASVLATEQGSKAVEKGVEQAEHAGEAISSLLDSIEEAAQAATQIAASSQQQLAGTDQVALAMQNIKQASAQNVAAIKQAETAARGLNQLGQNLKKLVQQNKL